MLKILAVLVIATACASVPQTDARLAPDAGVVVVKNAAPVAATVYAIDRGAKIRLGMVTASSDVPFPIRTSGTSLAFYIVSTSGNVRTNAIQNVRAGDRLVVNIDPTVALSYATR